MWHGATLFFICLIASLPALLVSAQETNITGPVAAPFLSRPDLDSIVLNVTLHNDSLITPGYIFLAPYQVLNPGPYIFDNTGALIYSGYAELGPADSHDFRVCTYQGSDHLCLYQGVQELGYSRGHALILDNSYSIVKSVSRGNGLPSQDQHEFNTLDTGETALVTIYQPLQYDLTAYNVTGGQGWIMNCLFQEVEIQTAEVLFQWSSLDHVDPSASYILPNTTDVSGTGETKDTAWDYFHINSVDKNSGGDYLVSSRHVETVYKINGSSGDIIWQLGGKESSFEMVNGLNFSFQHNARFRAENSTTTTISIFDNAYDGFNGSSLFSQGKIIAVSNETMKAELLMAYGAPDPSGGLVSASQGNVQYLPNGNKFLGWGSQCYVSESTDDGTPVFYAYFATTGALQYRSYRFNFTGNPTTTPALYTYAKDTTSQTAYYVSWNGATEVGSWNIYSGSEPTSLQMVGSVKKNGFETTTTVPQYYAYTIVEAVAGNGTALRNSTVIKTFVPGPQLAQSCTDIQCPLIGGYQVEPVVQAIQSTLIAPTITNTPTPTTDLPASTSADQSTGNLTSTSPAQVGSASRLRSPGLDPWLPIIALSIACVSAVSWFS